MLASIEAKLIALAAVILLLVVGVSYYGHTRYRAGQTAVQAKWDASQVAQQQAVAKAQAQNDIASAAMRDEFNALSAKYEAAVHAKAPAVADSVAAGVAGGSLRLRNAGMCPGAGQVSAATARSRAADAAATQALVDRVAAAIRIVRIGDAADARELQLRAQVTGLQAVLAAERREH
ncbi:MULTISPECIES: hypothetical protein [unclassified Rhodanobacter]|uniref:hypothetical protein n=1 Tax=unclassified Rhodanobacter TaxID=2621553 RepID=UPI001BDE81DD|nr:MULTISPECIES: hypothetical protein [unclassified Rhodanobacter]MBT2142697.1 hypothetical protein [Rhodanobacter sp. LX-99]MBT2148230.1 hypothetical protein [Rhodanobacter sp. LX-100]